MFFVKMAKRDQKMDYKEEQERKKEKREQVKFRQNRRTKKDVFTQED